MFKNMKIGTKIIAGFSSILILLVAVSVLAYISLSSSSTGFGNYREMARDTNLAGRIQGNLLMVRMNVKDFIMTGSEKDVQEYEAYLKKVEGFTAEAQKEINDPERAAKIDHIDANLKNYSAGFAEVMKFRAKRDSYVNDVFNVKGPLMETSLASIMISANKDNNTTGVFHSGMATHSLLLARLYMTKFLDTNDQKTVDRVHKEFGKMQEYLNIMDKELLSQERRSLLATTIAAREVYLSTFDDLVNTIFDRNKIITGTLNRIGPEIAKDIEDVKLSIKATQDDIGPKLVASNKQSITFILLISSIAVLLGLGLAFLITRAVTKPIMRIVENLSSGAEQVAAAAGQVSSASQSLAEGSSEQAASLEETSSSVEEMASMTKQNADNSDQADSLTQETATAIQIASTSITTLSEATDEIYSASQETQKIVKNIDEIAFQTNLLALNAAVEAARAGEAGAGFAVVADEVRNLAARSAESAKSTAELIGSTVGKVSASRDIAAKSLTAVSEVVTISGKVSELISEISAASQEQSNGIGQINIAVAEMDKVTQQNAANAEESAAAAEELNAQAEQMRDFVSELLTMVTGVRELHTNISPSRHQTSKRAAPSKQIALSHNRTAPKFATNPKTVIPFNDDKDSDDFDGF